MKIATTIAEVRAQVAAWKKEGLTVGLVPTMGYLHEGHASLVDEAVRQCDRVVASVFVNPTQFGPNEDLEDYPRDFDRDKALLEEPLFSELSQKYGKTNAQIILRWHIQAGNIVIPGSKNPAHIKDNFDLFDFSLTEEEMAKITALDKDTRYYTSTPEMLRRYAEMVPDVDGQK